MSFRNNDWHNYILNDFIKYSSEKIDIEKISEFNYISTENMLPNKGQIINASSLPKSKTVTKYSIGDTLISNIRPYFKKIWFANKIGGASNDVLVIKSDNALVDKKFLYYLLSEDSFFDYVMLTSKGTKMPRGDKGAILNYKASLPPLKEQKAIAKILSDLDEKIEVNNKINKNLEEMAQAIFKQWFVDFEFPNEEGKPYKSSGGEMVESELGMIPKGWEISKLGNYIELYDSKRIPLSKNEREKREKIYPYYGAASLMDFVDDYIFEGVYILMGEDGTVSDNLGYPILQYVWGKFWVNNHAHVIKGVLDISEEFIYILLKNTNVKQIITGAVQPKINQKNLREVNIVMPVKKDIVKKYSDLVNKMFFKIRILTDENERLEKLRDTLLPKLMSGEIRVPLENSED
ncbi:restriction endonuclease subunit S [Clostridium perfringens]|uniref:restriction endonuclease subunit S n=1 Tax=Clostridium perfringens TaxID=1502 RepID=UPI0018E450D5|nr:restriction endonuclease subunit S [Clostridium perfringens]MBI6093847.1 restriction endonuclease subunit S [Clostridium perfringens]MDV5114380.1 restriction endonuclease subunit S [Clostridium perfringens]